VEQCAPPASPRAETQATDSEKIASQKPIEPAQLPAGSLFPLPKLESRRWLAALPLLNASLGMVVLALLTRFGSDDLTSSIKCWICVEHEETVAQSLFIVALALAWLVYWRSYCVDDGRAAWPVPIIASSIIFRITRG